MRCGATRPGYVDYLDATGRDLGWRAGAREQAAYVRRWVIGRQPGAWRRRRGRGDRRAGRAGVGGGAGGGRRSDAPDRSARRRPAARRAGAPGVMRGASLIELLIAVALALVISAVGVRALVEAASAFAWQPASAELSARADAVAQLLTADLAAAGAGPRARLESGGGPLVAPPSIRLSSWLPPILPRVVGLDGADADDSAATDRAVDPHRGRRRSAGGGAPVAAAVGLPARADVPGDRRWLRRPRRPAGAVARGAARLPAGRSRRRGRREPGRARRDAGRGRRARRRRRDRQLPFRRRPWRAGAWPRRRPRPGGGRARGGVRRRAVGRRRSAGGAAIPAGGRDLRHARRRAPASRRLGGAGGAVDPARRRPPGGRAVVRHGAVPVRRRPVPRPPRARAAAARGGRRCRARPDAAQSAPAGDAPRATCGRRVAIDVAPPALRGPW